MFLLDTNVVSELRRPATADPKVVAWANALRPFDLFLSAITVLELETGALRLARRDPKAGRAIRRWIDDRVMPSFVDRIIGIDTDIARRCATLHVPDPRPYRDSLIAATALVHQLTVVTRNQADFTSMGVQVLNPW